MIKKLIVVAVVGGLAVAALKGTKWASYVRSEVKSWRDAAEDSVPPEKEIARLRGFVYIDHRTNPRVVAPRDWAGGG